MVTITSQLPKESSQVTPLKEMFLTQGRARGEYNLVLVPNPRRIVQTGPQHPLPVGTHCSYADYSPRINCRIVNNDPASEEFQRNIEKANEYHKEHNISLLDPADFDYLIVVDDEKPEPLAVQAGGVGALVSRAEHLRGVDRHLVAG